MGKKSNEKKARQYADEAVKAALPKLLPKEGRIQRFLKWGPMALFLVFIALFSFVKDFRDWILPESFVPAVLAPPPVRSATPPREYVPIPVPTATETKPPAVTTPSAKQASTSSIPMPMEVVPLLAPQAVFPSKFEIQVLDRELRTLEWLFIPKKIITDASLQDDNVYSDGQVFQSWAAHSKNELTLNAFLQINQPRPNPPDKVREAGVLFRAEYGFRNVVGRFESCRLFKLYSSDTSGKRWDLTLTFDRQVQSPRPDDPRLICKP